MRIFVKANKITHIHNGNIRIDLDKDNLFLSLDGLSPGLLAEYLKCRMKPEFDYTSRLVENLAMNGDNIDIDEIDGNAEGGAI